MKDCLFCKIIQGEIKSWKVYEDESVYAFLDVNPVNEYHTLVIPKNHYENLFDIPEDELVKVVLVVQKLALFYKDHLGINNVQIISSSGKEAQQDIFHVHFHIIPREKNDGQNINWKTHPEWQEKFDLLLMGINGIE